MGREGWATMLVIGAATALVSSSVDWSRAPLLPMIPIIAATVAQLLPPVAVHARRSPELPARDWIAVWSIVFFLSDLAQIFLGRTLGNNLFFLSFSHPVEDGVLLWAYSWWQDRPVTRLAFRFAIPLLALVSLLIAVKAGEVRTFNTFSSPFRALILLSAAVSTLVARSVRESGNVRDKDWWWTSLGVALYFGTYVTVEPVSKLLLANGSPMSLEVFSTKGLFDCLAFSLIWKGMRCPKPTASSGSTWALR